MKYGIVGVLHYLEDVITKSLGISQLVHSISNLDVPQRFHSAVNTAIFRFFEKGKKDKIKRKVFSDYDKGGLRAPCIDVLAKSLRLTWISRLLTDEQMSNESWKAIPNYLFEQYGGLNFILRCNYDKKFLELINTPQFYKSILRHFLELKESFKNAEVVSGNVVLVFQ